MAGQHLVVDGSNIATEGRTVPSLAQLDEAVRSFLDQNPYPKVTVVVDATFGHRIDPSEREAYEDAVTNGELVSPPAGAIGRGDAFVLQIADRADADVLSNDSFQEFHGVYPWLFDEGRLIGGKPVPDVGWVFVLRAPVRGPASRKAVRAAASPRKKRVAAAPVATPTTTDVPVTTVADAAQAPAATDEAGTPTPVTTETAESRGGSGRRGTGTARPPLNVPLVYTNFVIDHPLGSVVEGVVDRFSSHGAYVIVGSAKCYVPLKALGDPPPRSAREVLKVGETRRFVVHRFDPHRKGIDLVPAAADRPKTDSGTDAAEAVAAATETEIPVETAQEAPVSPAAKKAPAKKAAAKKSPAKKAATKKAAPAKKAPAKKAPAKKSAAKKAPAKKAPAKKSAAKKAPASKAAAKKSAAKKAPARKAAAKKS